MNGIILYNLNDDTEPKLQKKTIAQNPFEKLEIHPKSLLSFGFTRTEVSFMLEAVRSFGRVPVAELQQMGMTLEQAKRLKYAYDICIGRIVIESDDDWCKHLRRMFGQHKRLELHDLELSTVDRVPRFAVVARIEDEIYKKLNSKNYRLQQRLYSVISVSSRKVVIRVDKNRKPMIPYGYSRKLEGIEIIGVNAKEKTAEISLSYDFCRLCNRYSIVASFRRPEFHLGLIEIICCEGSRLYVFAIDLGTKERPNLGSTNVRVYAYGTFPKHILPILRAITAKVYRKVNGVKFKEVEATATYEVIAKTAIKDEIVE